MSTAEKTLNLPIIKKLIELAHVTNVPTYIVGGYVRDLYLNKESKDIDIVVEGNGLELAKQLANELGKSATTTYFKNFGTAQLKFDDWVLEFVGTRKESYSKESRNPNVEPGTLKDDQLRRDFTINAMYLSLNKDSLGLFLDPFNGVEHLTLKVIDTPLNPQITFDDDPLRMLRAIRFAARFSFKLSERVRAAIKLNAERINIISTERIIEEVNGMILTDKPSVAFKLLDETGLLFYILPELIELKGAEIREGRGHKDNFYHTLQVLDNISNYSANLWLRWAAILHDIAKPATKRWNKKSGWTFHGHEELGARWVYRIFKRLRLPLDEKMKFVESLVRLHLRPIALTKETVTDSGIRRLIVDAGDNLKALLTLCRADITSKNETKVAKYLQNLDRIEVRMAELLESDNLRNWQPVVSGNHIMERYILNTPKEIGILKEYIRNAILDEKVTNTLNEALVFLDSFAVENNIQLKNI